MNDVPDIEIIGDAYKFELEMSADGSSVLVAYTRGEAGTVGRSWIRFDPKATVALQRQAANLHLPRSA